VPPELHATTELRGGIVGAGDLAGCKSYNSPETFAGSPGQSEVPFDLSSLADAPPAPEDPEQNPGDAATS